MKTIVFDLNGTLTESKQPIDDEMAELLAKLMGTSNVVIITGGTWKQTQKQVLGNITTDISLLNNLYLLPTSGGSMYQTWSKYGWVATYQNKLNKKDVDRITNAIEDAVKDSGWNQPDRLWGKQIENRECQITFSALGQNAPIEEKVKFDPDFSKRRALCEVLQSKLQSYHIRMGGTTSIDISLSGADKRYGIDELMKRLHISKDDVFYIGDTIFKGGSDYAAVEMGLDHICVKNITETKGWIRDFLAQVSLGKTG